MNIKYLNLIGFIGVLTINILSNTLPINGRTTGGVSDEYANLFAPAGFTFSIWGIIYLALLGFVLYPFLKQSEEFNSKNERIGILFFLSCLVNISWIFCWHYLQIGLSLFLMIVLLGLLARIYYRLHDKTFQLSSTKFFLSVTFSLYLGWICVATIANFTTFLVSTDLDKVMGASPFWFVSVIVVAFLVAIFFLQKYNDTVVSLVIIWSFVGISVKRMNDEVTMHEPWANLSLILAIVLGVFTIWKMIRNESIYLKKLSA